MMLLLALVLADAPRTRTAAVAVPELARLTFGQALTLEGREALYRVSLDSRPDERGGRIVYDCASLNDVLRTVWLEPGQEFPDELTVRGTLRLVYHRSSRDGMYPGFWE